MDSGRISVQMRTDELAQCLATADDEDTAQAHARNDRSDWSDPQQAKGCSNPCSPGQSAGAYHYHFFHPCVIFVVLYYLFL